MELRPILETPFLGGPTLTLTTSGARFGRGLQVPLLERLLTARPWSATNPSCAQTRFDCCPVLNRQEHEVLEDSRGDKAVCPWIAHREWIPEVVPGPVNLICVLPDQARIVADLAPGELRERIERRQQLGEWACHSGNRHAPAHL
jgi:hypothetical protein